MGTERAAICATDFQSGCGHWKQGAGWAFLPVQSAFPSLLFLPSGACFLWHVIIAIMSRCADLWLVFPVELQQGRRLVLPLVLRLRLAVRLAAGVRGTGMYSANRYKYITLLVIISFALFYIISIMVY